MTGTGCVAQHPPEQVSVAELASTSELDSLDSLVQLDPFDAMDGSQKMDGTNRRDMRERFLISLELTKREREIALLLFEGRNNPYIRGILNISNNTLKTHLRNIYRKAMIKDRQQLLDLFKEFVIRKEIS